MITWHRPSWRRLKTFQEINLNINPEELLPQNLTYRQQININDPDSQYNKLEEGSLDLGTVKEITIGTRNHEYDAELLEAGKRYGLTHIESCVTILYGLTASDNRVLYLLCPPMICRIWYVSLNWIIKAIKRQHRLADRSMLWLKEQYIKLYFEDSNCSEPLAGSAIQVFGGRNTTHYNVVQSSFQLNDTIETLRRENSTKLKKKRSVVNLLTQVTSNAPDTESDIKLRPTERKKNKLNSYDQMWDHSTHFRVGSITYETQLDFLDFISLFRSFR